MLKWSPITVYMCSSTFFSCDQFYKESKIGIDIKFKKKKKTINENEFSTVTHMAVISRGSLSDLVNKYFFFLARHFSKSEYFVNCATVMAKNDTFVWFLL